MAEGRAAMAMRMMHRINERHNISKRTRLLSPDRRKNMPTYRMVERDEHEPANTELFRSLGEEHTISPRSVLYTDVYLQDSHTVIILLRSRRNAHTIRNIKLLHSIWRNRGIGSFKVRLLSLHMCNENQIIWRNLDRRLISVHKNYIQIG